MFLRTQRRPWLSWVERCLPRTRVKLAGVKSEEERVLEYNGLRGCA